MILPPALKRWGPPRRQGLCSHLADLWATFDFAPRSEAVGTPPPDGRGYVASLTTCGPPVMPTFGPPLILPPLLSDGDPLGGRGYVATLPTCGPPLIVPPALKRWGPPRRQGLCSHVAHFWATSDAHFWATSDSALRSEAMGTPRRQGLCSHLAHFWATSDSTPRSEAVGTPQAAGVCSHLPQLWATCDSAPRFVAVGTP